MPVLSADEIYEVARAAGFAPDQATTMTSIALAESGGNTAHRGVGEDSRGLWQINVQEHPEIAERYDLDDPLGNAQAAYELSRGGTDLSPWTTTHGGSRRALLIGGAVAAVAAIVIGLWVGSTLGDSEQTSTSTLTTPAPTATTAPPTAAPTPTISTPAPTPTVITVPPPVPETPPPPEPPPEPPQEPAVPAPTIVNVRAVSRSPNGCMQPWTAQVVVAVQGDVSAVTASWVPATGGDATEVALSAAGNGWLGRLVDLPPGTELQLSVRAEGSGGIAESDGQTIACER